MNKIIFGNDLYLNEHFLKSQMLHKDSKIENRVINHHLYVSCKYLFRS